MDAYQIIANAVESNTFLLNKWFAEKGREFSYPIYSSFDIRDSGFKCASVDANFFPSGFNNLKTTSCQKGAHFFKLYIDHNYPGTRHIHIYPESHTRNSSYIKNIQALKEILTSAGYFVTSGSNDLNSFSIKCGSNINFNYDSLILVDEGIIVEGIGKPDLILLNNDLSRGVPAEILLQQTTPPVKVGWHNRQKSQHFKFLNKCGIEVADLLGIDPWLFLTHCSDVQGINLLENASWDRLCSAVDDLLDCIRSIYHRYNINSEPRVFVKNNSGTYGVGILCVNSGEDLRQLSVRARRKAFYARSGVLPNSFLIQEAVPTKIYSDEIPCESVFYLIGNQIAGQFLRMNPNGGEFTNLNTPSASFIHDEAMDIVSEAQRTAYSFLAQISSLAMGIEMQSICKQYND